MSNHPRNIAIGLIALTALAISGAMLVRSITSRGAHAPVDRAIYPVCGIDVSAHNGEVDFDRVKAAGVDFVYIKASEGATWRDACFETNYRRAVDAGLAVGIYHFFRFDVEGWRQSVNVMRAINGRHLDLPVAIDIEEWGNPGGVPTQRVVTEARSMIELLRRQGREVIIYTNKNGYYRFVRDNFDDVALWVCGFTNPPMRDRARWTMWQHSHLGRIDGVRGRVDLNTYNTPVHGAFDDYLSASPAISTLNPRYPRK